VDNSRGVARTKLVKQIADRALIHISSLRELFSLVSAVYKVGEIIYQPCLAGSLGFWIPLGMLAAWNRQRGTKVSHTHPRPD